MKKVMFVLLCLISMNGVQASPLWSSCQTVTAVSDYRSYNGSIYLTVSPGVGQCGGSIKRMRIMEGQNSVNFETLEGALALGSTALVTGKKVQFYYDNATTSCFIRIISLGGYNGQCK